MGDCTDDSHNPCLERHFKGHRGEITALAFNPTVRQLVSASLDTTLMVWNLREPTAKAFRFIGHTDGVLDTSIAPNGELVASASKDRTVRFWLPTVQGGLGMILAHSGIVRSVEFSANGNQLLTSADDQTIKLWSVEKKKSVSTFLGHTNWIRCARFDPNNNFIIGSCSDDKTVKLIDLRTGQCGHTFCEPKGIAVKLAFNPLGSYLGTAMSNGVIKVYDLRTFRVVQHYTTHTQCVSAISFHPNGRLLMSGSMDGNMQIIDLYKGRPLFTVGPQDKVTGIAAVTFSAKGHHFASGSKDHQVRIWRTNCNQVNNLAHEKASPGNGRPMSSEAPVAKNVDDEMETGVEPNYTTLNIEKKEKTGCEKDQACCCLANKVDVLQRRIEAMMLKQNELDKLIKERLPKNEHLNKDD